MKVKETEVFIVVSSLNKDMNSTEYSFKANSMKVLSKIIGTEELPVIERYLRQAILDKNEYVQKGALISGIILFNKAPENIKKWSNDVQDKLNSSNGQIVYLALILMALIKSSDLFSASRILQMVMNKDLRKMPLAHCQLIREMKRLLLSEELDSKTYTIFMEYIVSCLSAANSDMVIIEASKAICEVAPNSLNYLESVYNLLQSMLAAPKSLVKYSALRILKRIAPTQLQLVSQCAPELEKLVTYANKSVASMAISILLKIAKEKNVDELLSTISQYLSEMADEFRVDAIQSVKHLIKRYPGIYKLLTSFLRKCLRLQSSLEFKREIIESVVYIIQTVGASREEALYAIVDLIEDCQYESLISRGLEIMANEIPLLENGEPFIKFICNRLILEGEKVRASAVTALAKLGWKKPKLQFIIKNVLMKCLIEQADEVRDRAALYLHTLNLGAEERNSLAELVFGEKKININVLESYLKNNKKDLVSSDKPLQIDLDSLKAEEVKETKAER
jgi:coatomer protein complex subunit gamma